MRPVPPFARTLRVLLRDNRGATAVEYGFIIALVVLAMFAAMSGFAETILRIWTYVADVVVRASGGA